jgi:ATP-binding cassette, subfamily C (CFTR/MRP), member 1
MYLFMSILLDTARARTLWMLGFDRAVPVLFTCSLAVRAVMLVLESTEKRSILVPAHKGCSEEVTSGAISRSVFFWLTSLFVSGYKKILEMDDLYPLDPKLGSEGLNKALSAAWNTG